MINAIAEQTKPLMLSSMPIFETDRVSILAPTKAGHTAFYDLFNKTRYSEYRPLTEWNNSNKQKILVLRNPIERMHSAIAFFKKSYTEGQPILPPDPSNRNQLLNKIFNKSIPLKEKQTEIEFFIFHIHCRPFLKYINTNDFKIIKFENLEEYLPRYNGVPTTNTSNTRLTSFRKNPFFTKEELLEELSIYNTFSNKEVVDVEQWKELIK